MDAAERGTCEMTTPLQITLDQFTHQAETFAAAPQIRDEAALRLLLDLTEAGADDTALDVACGPGLVACAFAERVRHATGIDLVPAMLEQARGLQARKQLQNVTWRLGPVPPLPFPDASFTIVTARYAFHHFAEPGAALAEMTRVCAPGGRVLVCDVVASPDPRKAEAFNRMERLRDPSHVRALTAEEIQAFLTRAGLLAPRAKLYRLEFELERLLEGSRTEPVAAGQVRAQVQQSLAEDTLGVGLRSEGGVIHVSYPIMALCAEKPVLLGSHR